MGVSAFHSFNPALRAMVKLLVFVFALFAATFSASAGYGLLRMFLQAVNRGADVGIAESATHGGLTIVFFGLAVSGAYIAKKCYW